MMVVGKKSTGGSDGFTRKILGSESDLSAGNSSFTHSGRASAVIFYLPSICSDDDLSKMLIYLQKAVTCIDFSGQQHLQIQNTTMKEKDLEKLYSVKVFETDVPKKVTA